MTNFVYFQLIVPAKDFFYFFLHSFMIYVMVRNMEPMFWVYNMHVEDLKRSFCSARDIIQFYIQYLCTTIVKQIYIFLILHWEGGLRIWSWSGWSEKSSAFLKTFGNQLGKPAIRPQEIDCMGWNHHFYGAGSTMHGNYL